MPGYLHSVPARNALRSDAGRASGTKRLLPQSFFNTSSSWLGQGSVYTATYLMPVGPFLVTRKFPEGFAEVRCIT
jgi:hypothetical protein